MRLSIKQFLLGLLICLPLIVLSAENKIYKTRDADGNIIYTDQAPENATEVEVEEPVNYIKSEGIPKFQSKPDLKLKKKPPGYKTLLITSPAPNDTIRTNAGTLQVLYEMSPNLQSNHSLQLLVDGSVAQSTKSGAFTLNNLDRGTHQLQLQIIDSQSGKVLKSSASVSVTILRHSVQHTQINQSRTSN